MPDRRLQPTRHAAHTLLTAHEFNVVASRPRTGERPAVVEPGRGERGERGVVGGGDERTAHGELPAFGASRMNR